MVVVAVARLQVFVWLMLRRFYVRQHQPSLIYIWYLNIYFQVQVYIYIICNIYDTYDIYSYLYHKYMIIMYHIYMIYTIYIYLYTHILYSYRLMYVAFEACMCVCKTAHAQRGRFAVRKNNNKEKNKTRTHDRDKAAAYRPTKQQHRQEQPCLLPSHLTTAPPPCALPIHASQRTYAKKYPHRSGVL